MLTRPLLGRLYSCQPILTQCINTIPLPSKQTTVMQHKEKKGFCWSGLGDGGETQPHTEHSICPFSNLHWASLSTPGSRPASWSSLHPFMLPTSSNAGSQVFFLPDSTLPPGPEQCRLSSLPMVPIARDTPLRIYSPQKEAWELKRIFLFYKYLNFFSVTHKDLNLNSSFSFYRCLTSVKLHNLSPPYLFIL